jgi:hypothetical protein
VAGLIQINLRHSAGAHVRPMWHSVSNAPFDRDIELAVVDEEGTHPLVFACRRIAGGWMNAATKERLDVRPTHWREWTAENVSRSG